jgi:hypothetical protein
MFWRSFAKEIAALRRRLEVGDPAERRKVARELVDLCIIKDDPEDALPLLEELLNDADSEIAAAAGRGLSACAALAVEPCDGCSFILSRTARARLRLPRVDAGRGRSQCRPTRLVEGAG